MITIRYTATEAAAMRDRIRLALEHPDTPEGQSAAAELRSLASELDAATATAAPRWRVVDLDWSLN
jgi:hypothetical protein